MLLTRYGIREWMIITLAAAILAAAGWFMDWIWLAIFALVAWPARHGDECMGVFFLFRNKSEPFADELAGLIDALRPVFAAQMAKLVRIHHRSNFAWPQVQDNGDESDDGESDGEEWRRAA